MVKQDGGRANKKRGDDMPKDIKSIKEWTQIEVAGSTFIPFKWRDDTPGGSNLGRAEFQVCLKFKRGKVSEFWVYPRQQRDATTCWHIITTYQDFHISSY